MRKYVLSFALGFMSLLSYAQSNYEKAMTEKINKLEATRSPEELQALANDFQRIADKEKDKWQPSYYTALAYIQKGRAQMQGGNNQALEETADQARNLWMPLKRWKRTIPRSTCFRK